MTLTLDEVEHVAQVIKTGAGVYELEAGTRLRILTRPDGIEIMDSRVPDGKKWKVLLSIHIEETSV